jgi:hypothetical protein
MYFKKNEIKIIKFELTNIIYKDYSNTAVQMRTENTSKKTDRSEDY